MQGFFNIEDSAPTSTGITKCSQCGRLQHCNSPKLTVEGEGRKGLLIIGPQPSAIDDEKGKLLSGQSGIYLSQFLADHNINMRRDCWIANAVSCHGKMPNTKEIKACFPSIDHLIKEHKPRVVIMLGIEATESVVKWKKDALDGIGRWHGWTIPDREYKTWLCPQYSLQDVLQKEADDVIHVVFRQDMERALSKLDEEVPEFEDEKSRVLICKDPDKLAFWFRNLQVTNVPVSFDYETTGLKPDRKGHKIISCAIACNGGEDVIAFPVNEQTRGLLKEFLENPCPKIAANIKYEETWSRVILGTPVNNWYWDTMQMAHIQDNRPKITSVKFQAYVRYGLADYDSHISPYLQGVEDNANSFNRIHEIPEKELLIYNGVDALLEGRIFRDQQKEIGL